MTTTLHSNGQNTIPATASPTLPRRVDIAVVGGGLAGLTAAATAARAGRSVVLLDGAATLGGRARTRTDHGFAFNIGPHAFYRNGASLRILRDLGVAPRVAEVGYGSGVFAVQAGRLHKLPLGLGSLLTTSLLGWRSKLEAATFLAGLAKLDPAPLDHVPLDQWLQSAIRNPEVRQLVAVSIRTASYAHDPSRLSAGAGLRQLQVGMSGALYVDGGWQTVVDTLRIRAEALGVVVHSGTRVERVTLADGGRAVRGVRLASGQEVEANAVVLAVPPRAASGLVLERASSGQPTLARWADTAVPVRAAALDVGLRRLPYPDRWFALGFDRPLYLSVHSRWADLAPEGGALVHVLRYLGTEPRSPHDEAELEGLLDLVQPGWHDEVVSRRFLPEVTVAGALPSVAWEGEDGPRGPAVPDTDGLFVAGDWVGPDGMLADRAIGSGARAGLAASAASLDAVRTGPRVSATMVIGGSR
jgi:phytoene dehydrogenase-like protein